MPEHQKPMTPTPTLKEIKITFLKAFAAARNDPDGTALVAVIKTHIVPMLIEAARGSQAEIIEYPESPEDYAARIEREIMGDRKSRTEIDGQKEYYDDAARSK